MHSSSRPCCTPSALAALGSVILGPMLRAKASLQPGGLNSCLSCCPGSHLPRHSPGKAYCFCLPLHQGRCWRLTAFVIANGMVSELGPTRQPQLSLEYGARALIKRSRKEINSLPLLCQARTWQSSPLWSMATRYHPGKTAGASHQTHRIY